MRTLFLSYSHKDIVFAQKLAEDLKKDDVVVWIACIEIDVGDSNTFMISEAMRDHDYFAPILSPDYLASPWCQRELSVIMSLFIQGKAKILPILRRNCEIPTLISDLFYADFRYDYSKGLASLIKALHTARRTELLPSSEQSIVIGNLEWRHNASVIVEVLEAGKLIHPRITHTRQASVDDEPDEGDFSIEFDLTSYALTDSRLLGIDIEVVNWKPIGQITKAYMPPGLGNKRIFFGVFYKEVGTYPCRFMVPKGYVKLSHNEMEVIHLQINTPDEGVYDLRIHVCYSIEGEFHTVSTDTIKELWFIDKQSTPPYSYDW